MILEKEKEKLDNRVYMIKLEMIKTNDPKKKELMKQLIEGEIAKFEEKEKIEKEKDKKENIVFGLCFSLLCVVGVLAVILLCIKLGFIHYKFK